MDKSQREYYLRQQLAAIKKELGETDEEGKVEVEEYRDKIEKKNLPPEAKKEAERELDRLAKMHPSSAEFTVSTTYLDWMTALPWNESTEDNLDIKKARRVLDEDHYGLEKAKKRIIEYLAVRKLKPNSKGPILCLAGPPGTGKTSLGHSIARALGRKFIRMSLGGVHGTRRRSAATAGHTSGALPGQDHPGNPAGRVQQPRIHARRDRQGGKRLPRRSLLGTPGGPRPGTELLLLGPLPRRPFRPVARHVRHDGQRPGDDSAATARPPGGHRAVRLYDRREDPDRPALPDSRGRWRPTASRPDQIGFTKSAVGRIITCYTREAGVRNLETGDRLGLPGRGQPGRPGRDRKGIHHDPGPPPVPRRMCGSPPRRRPAPPSPASSWALPGRRAVEISSSSRPPPCRAGGGSP